MISVYCIIYFRQLSHLIKLVQMVNNNFNKIFFFSHKASDESDSLYLDSLLFKWFK